jgi:hypothetical protein
MSAAGQTATRAWIDLPQWPAREISPHKHARPDGRYDPFRLRGNWRFDRVGAVGGCAAISATQDVMARNSADVRFGSKADIEARPRNVRFTPESRHRSAQRNAALCQEETFRQVAVVAGSLTTRRFVALPWHH